MPPVPNGSSSEITEPISDQEMNRVMAINSRNEFDTFIKQTVKRLNVPEEYRGYYSQHADRLWLTANEFGLLRQRYSSLLEIGPGFSFLPFIWKGFVAQDVAVFEGEADELREFASSYKQCGIEAHYGDLFDIFGQRDGAKNRLPFGSEAFDCIICWETMEHFNFNPIPFLHEVQRIMRPKGILNLTIPNQAKLDRRLKLLLGKSVRTPIDTYFLQMDDRNRMKYAPHWREYTLEEFVELLCRAGLKIVRATHLQTFENREHRSAALLAKRALATMITRLFPAFSALCLVQAQKP